MNDSESFLYSFKCFFYSTAGISAPASKLDNTSNPQQVKNDSQTNTLHFWCARTSLCIFQFCFGSNISRTMSSLLRDCLFAQRHLLPYTLFSVICTAGKGRLIYFRHYIGQTMASADLNHHSHVRMTCILCAF